MFINDVKVSHDSKRKIYTYNGFFGFDIKRLIQTNIISPKKLDALVIKISAIEIKVYEFFLVELRYTLNKIITVQFQYINAQSLKRVIELIDIRLDDDGSNKIDPTSLTQVMKFNPLPNQLPLYDEFPTLLNVYKYRGGLIEGKVGTGKTYMSLSLSVAYESNATIIIAPLETTKLVWGSSLGSGIGALFKSPQTVYHITDKLPYEGERFIISHYEALDKLMKLLSKEKLLIDTLIVDEYHNFNDPKSKRSKELLSVVKLTNPRLVIPMSGTPVRAKMSDLVMLFHLISPDFNDVIARRATTLYSGGGFFSKSMLKSKYSTQRVEILKNDKSKVLMKTVTTKHKLKNGKYFTLSAIKSRCLEYIERRTSEIEERWDEHVHNYNRLCQAVRKDLEEVDGVTRDFDIYDADIREIKNNYARNTLLNIPDVISRAKSFEKNVIEPRLSSGDRLIFRNVKSIIKYLDLKLRGEVLANVLGKARIDCYGSLGEYVVDYKTIINSTIKKTVVFSSYIEVCDRIMSKTKELGLSPVGVYGGESKNLVTHVSSFTNIEDCNPLVTTYKSLSTGVPLIAANVMIILGLPYRSSILEQTIGRVWREGQDTNVMVHIIELDTDDEPNITNRDFDIITFFKREVSTITGYESDVNLEVVTTDISETKSHLDTW